MNPTSKEIAEKAYELWQDLGRPWGLANHIWIRAEKELVAAITPTPVPAPVETKKKTAKNK